MMALDPINNLDEWPLKGLDEFIKKLREKAIQEVNLTGTNTDPLLYKHLKELKARLLNYNPYLCFGLRTNGALHRDHSKWNLFDKVSISIPTLDEYLYGKIMGGKVPSLYYIKCMHKMPIKINIVLCPEIPMKQVVEDIKYYSRIGIRQVNLREPYGQPHIGNPFISNKKIGYIYGMPTYEIDNVRVTYWDVHYCEVESVNLYANGKVSLDYTITRGHDESGKVLDQSNFTKSGRITKQWVTT